MAHGPCVQSASIICNSRRVSLGSFMQNYYPRLQYYYSDMFFRKRRLRPVSCAVLTLRRLHFLPRLGYRRQILTRALLDNVVAALFDRRTVHKLAAHRHGASAGFEEIAGVLQIDAAGGDHLD